MENKEKKNTTRSKKRKQPEATERDGVTCFICRMLVFFIPLRVNMTPPQGHAQLSRFHLNQRKEGSVGTSAMTLERYKSAKADLVCLQEGMHNSSYY